VGTSENKNIAIGLDVSGYTIIKYGANGNEIWHNHYFPGRNVNNNLNSGAYGVDVDANGNVYVTGELSYGNVDKVLTLKYNSAGERIGENTWGNSDQYTYMGRDLVIGSDGFIYVSVSAFNVYNNSDVLIIKIDPDSFLTVDHLIFSAEGHSNNDPRHIARDNQNSVYVCGVTYNISPSDDYLVAKINQSPLSLDWVNFYNGTAGGNDYANAIFVNSNNDVFVTGKSPGIGTFSDIVTIKYNTLGQEIGLNRFNDTQNKDDIGNNIIGDNQGNIYVCGKSGSGRSIVLKYDDQNLNVIWNHIFNFRGFLDCQTSEGISLAVDNISNIYVTGNISLCSDNNSNFLVYKLTGAGELNWFTFYDYENLNDAYITGGIAGKKIALDAQNNVYVTGIGNSANTGEDIVTLKISQSNFSGPQKSSLNELTSINGEIPRDFNLKQNYPNPFNPNTNIEFSIPKTGNVIINIYDITGKNVATLLDSYINPGNYKVNFDASNFASGLYFYTLKSEFITYTKKMLLIK
jgi:hypothetical protein